MKLKYGEKAKMCYMDNIFFIVFIRTDYIDKYIAEKFEIKVDTSSY